jgi:hypothetical protein
VEQERVVDLFDDALVEEAELERASGGSGAVAMSFRFAVGRIW